MAALAESPGQSDQPNRPHRRPTVMAVDAIPALPDGSLASFTTGLEDQAALPLVWVPPEVSDTVSIANADVSPDGLRIQVPVSRVASRAGEFKQIDPTLASECVNKAFGVTTLDELGKGGMGFVLKGPSYKATVTEPMAYKVGHAPLPPGKTLADLLTVDLMTRATGPAELLLKEARLQQHLSEFGARGEGAGPVLPGEKVSGIPTVHDIKEAVFPDGRRYVVIAMEFIHGDEPGKPSLTLDKQIGALRQIGADSEPLVAAFEPLVKSVGQMHRRGVIHRDIKPGNILGQALLDFGFATVDATVVPKFWGTLAYAAPEQIPEPGRAFPQASRAWDIYALGASLLHIVSGRPPGENNRPEDLTCDRALKAIIRKAMAHRPEDRYPSPEALASDLEARRTKSFVVARREELGKAGLAYGALHTLKQHWLLTGGVLAVGALLAGVPAIANHFAAKREADRERLDTRKEKENQLLADVDTRVKTAEALIARGNFAGALNLLPEDHIQAMAGARETATSDWVLARLDKSSTRYVSVRNDAKNILELQEDMREFYRNFKDPMSQKEGIPWNAEQRKKALSVYISDGIVTAESIAALHARLGREAADPLYRKLVLQNVRLLACLAVVEDHPNLLRPSAGAVPGVEEMRAITAKVQTLKLLCVDEDLFVTVLERQLLWASRGWQDDAEVIRDAPYGDLNNKISDSAPRASAEGIFGRTLFASQFPSGRGQLVPNAGFIQFIDRNSYCAALLQRWNASAQLRGSPPEETLRERTNLLKEVSGSSRLIRSIDPHHSNDKMALKDYYQYLLSFRLLGGDERVENTTNVLAEFTRLADNIFPDPSRIDWEGEDREVWLIYLNALADRNYLLGGTPVDTNAIIVGLFDRYDKKYPSDPVSTILRCETKIYLKQNLTDSERESLIAAAGRALHPSMCIRAAVTCLDLMDEKKVDPKLEAAIRKYFRAAVKEEPRCRTVITDNVIPNFPTFRELIMSAISEDSAASRP